MDTLYLSEQCACGAVPDTELCCCVQGNCVAVGVTTLTVTASLKNSSGNSVGGLEGNTTIRFSSCWANFTDLSILSSSTFLHINRRNIWKLHVEK